MSQGGVTVSMGVIFLISVVVVSLILWRLQSAAPDAAPRPRQLEAKGDTFLALARAGADALGLPRPEWLEDPQELEISGAPGPSLLLSRRQAGPGRVLLKIDAPLRGDAARIFAVSTPPDPPRGQGWFGDARFEDEFFVEERSLEQRVLLDWFVRDALLAWRADPGAELASAPELELRRGRLHARLELEELALEARDIRHIIRRVDELLEALEVPWARDVLERGLDTLEVEQIGAAALLLVEELERQGASPDALARALEGARPSVRLEADRQGALELDDEQRRALLEEALGAELRQAPGLLPMASRDLEGAALLAWALRLDAFFEGQPWGPEAPTWVPQAVASLREDLAPLGALTRAARRELLARLDALALEGHPEEELIHEALLGHLLRHPDTEAALAARRALSATEVARALASSWPSGQPEPARQRWLARLARELDAGTLACLWRQFDEQAPPRAELLLDAIEEQGARQDRGVVAEFRAHPGVQHLLVAPDILVAGLERRALLRRARQMLGAWRSAVDEEARELLLEDIFETEAALELLPVGAAFAFEDDERLAMVALLAAVLGPGPRLTEALREGLTGRWWSCWPGHGVDLARDMPVLRGIMRELAGLLGEGDDERAELRALLDQARDVGLVAAAAPLLSDEALRAHALAVLGSEQVEPDAWAALLEVMRRRWSAEDFGPDLARAAPALERHHALTVEVLGAPIEEERERDEILARLFTAATTPAALEALARLLEPEALERRLLAQLERARGEARLALIAWFGEHGTLGCVAPLAELTEGFFASGELRHRVEQAISSMQERAGVADAPGALSVAGAGGESGALTEAGPEGALSQTGEGGA